MFTEYLMRSRDIVAAAVFRSVCVLIFQIHALYGEHHWISTYGQSVWRWAETSIIYAVASFGREKRRSKKCLLRCVTARRRQTNCFRTLSGTHTLISTERPLGEYLYIFVWQTRSSDGWRGWFCADVLMKTYTLHVFMCAG